MWNPPNILMLLGALAFAIGECLGASSPEADDTASEWFKRQPLIVKAAIFFFAGAVFSHWAEWKIRDAIESKEN